MSANATYPKFSLRYNFFSLISAWTSRGKDVFDGTTVSCRPGDINTGSFYLGPQDLLACLVTSPDVRKWKSSGGADGSRVYAPGQVLSSERDVSYSGPASSDSSGTAECRPVTDPALDTSSQSESKCLYLADRLSCLNRGNYRVP